MKQVYEITNFHPHNLALIDQFNSIIDEYIDAGYRLTIRQLYYQMVARDLFGADRRFTWTGTKWLKDVNGTINADPNYKYLIKIVNHGRMSGLIDWDVIEDRTRSFEGRSRWNDGGEILRTVAETFHMDLWAGQQYRVYCAVEKEALEGICRRACYEYDVPIMAARGYPSVTVLREFALRDMEQARQENQTVIILHLGDHDPSGIDMSRDLESRLQLFGGALDFRRIALNMDQIKKQKPPENPAKETDSRFAQYEEQFGDKCWELDALKPDFLVKLIQTNIEQFIDHDIRDMIIDDIEITKTKLTTTAALFSGGYEPS